MRNVGSRIGLVTAAAVIVAGVVGQSAGALSRFGPDPGDMGGGAGYVTGYVLADQGSAINTRVITIPLYFTDNASNRALTIRDIDLCDDSRDSAPGSGNNYRDTGRNGSNTGSATRYSGQVITSISVPGNPTAANGYPSTSRTCYSNARTLVIPASSMVLQPDINVYRVFVTAVMPAGITGIQNHFNFELNNGIVGYSSAATARSFAIAQSYPPNRYKRYSLPFAPSCDVVGSQRNAIALYDDDNGTAFVQPNKFTVYLTRQNIATGAVNNVAIPSRDITATQKQAVGNNGWVITSGNQTNAYIWANFEQGYRYWFVLDSVYGVNLLQFRLPYDSIYSLYGCADWKITGATNSSSTIASPDDTITWNHTLTKEGSTAAPAINYSIEQSNTPIGAPRNYTAVGGGSGTSSANPTGTFLTRDTTYNVRQSDIGHLICQRIRWNPTSHTTAGASVSTEKCVKIGRIPTVQLWGSDARTGSGYVAGTGNNAALAVSALARYGTEYSGSWVEYGVLATGVARDLPSGSGVVFNRVQTQSSWSKLTFANQGATYGQFANASSMGLLPAIAQYFTATPAPNGVTIDRREPTSFNVSSFENKVVYTTGTVTITNDIVNNENANLQSVDNFPQMVIIANTINIVNTVTRVDAWLVAVPNGVTGGVINTCSNAPAQLRIADCDRQLTITGPTLAKMLRLRRTGGDRTTPAEIINLRSDAYLWARRLSERNSRWDTTYMEELPPRY